MNKQAYERCMSAVMHKEAGWWGDTWNTIKNSANDTWNGVKDWAKSTFDPSYDRQRLEGSRPSQQQVDMWNQAANRQNTAVMNGTSNTPGRFINTWGPESDRYNQETLKGRQDAQAELNNFKPMTYGKTYDWMSDEQKNYINARNTQVDEINAANKALLEQKAAGTPYDQLVPYYDRSHAAYEAHRNPLPKQPVVTQNSVVSQGTTTPQATGTPANNTGISRR